MYDPLVMAGATLHVSQVENHWLRTSVRGYFFLCFHRGHLPLYISWLPLLPGQKVLENPKCYTCYQKKGKISNGDTCSKMVFALALGCLPTSCCISGCRNERKLPQTYIAKTLTGVSTIPYSKGGHRQERVFAQSQQILITS